MSAETRTQRFLRRAEERASRQRAAVPQPENPPRRRRLPCLVDPNCPIDHLHRKRKGRDRG